MSAVLTARDIELIVWRVLLRSLRPVACAECTVYSPLTVHQSNTHSLGWEQKSSDRAISLQPSQLLCGL